MAVDRLGASLWILMYGIGWGHERIASVAQRPQGRPAARRRSVAKRRKRAEDEPAYGGFAKQSSAILDHPADLGVAGENERRLTLDLDRKAPLGQGHRIEQRVGRSKFGNEIRFSVHALSRRN